MAKHKHPRLRFLEKVQQPAPPDPERNGLNAFLDGWGAYYRHGNSTQQLDSLDWYVHNRLCRFISRKHGRRSGFGRGLAVLLASATRLGLHRLGGTVAYDSVRATR